MGSERGRPRRGDGGSSTGVAQKAGRSCPPERRKINPKDESFPKDEILRTRKDFDALFGHGQRTRWDCFTIIQRRAAQRKVGFALSRTIKGAVKRNRVKRQLREVYRRYKHRTVDDREFVIVAGEGVLAKSYTQIELELIRGLRKAGIICE